MTYNVFSGTLNPTQSIYCSLYCWHILVNSVSYSELGLGMWFKVSDVVRNVIIELAGIFPLRVACSVPSAGASLLWTHTLRPFINRPIALA